MIVETRSLGKRYGLFSALENCCLAIERGEVFGLLGTNGAGKTTLLRLLLGYLRPSSGSALVDGLDCQRQSVAVRRKVAYLPGEARMFRQMRGRDVLRFFASIRPDGDYARGLKLAERFELDVTRRVAFMSTGMRQKLALASTLSADTPLVILDEPTANLDPTVRATILELVGESRVAGRTVIFSSHVLAEVEEVCDRVVILRQGRVAHLQSMAELRRQHRVRLEPTVGVVQLPAHLKSQLTVVSNSDGQMVVDVAGSLSPVLEWLATLSLKDVTIESVGLRPIYDRFHARGEPSKEIEGRLSASQRGTKA